MNKLDTGLALGSLGVFVVAPYLPTSLYKFAFSSLPVPFLLILSLLVTMTYSRIGAVTLFLAVTALFVEYRRRVFLVKRDLPTPTYEEQLKPAPTIMPNEVHPEPRAPRGGLITYKPSSDATNEFDSVDQSMNQKQVLSTSRLPEQAQKYMIEHGLAQAQV